MHKKAVTSFIVKGILETRLSAKEERGKKASCNNI